MMTRKSKQASRPNKRFSLNPRARAWLRADDLAEGLIDEDDDDDEYEDPRLIAAAVAAAEDHDVDDQEDFDSDDAWERWLYRTMAEGGFIDVGGILVDRKVLTMPFSCVSERCAPLATRGKERSCCADLTVALCAPEVKRLRAHTGHLWPWLVKREPRLREYVLPPARGRRPFWLADDDCHLARPGGRCVFSMIDEQGRIRCHLHPYTEERGLLRRDVQPFPCRLFPLILVELPNGKVGLTGTYEETAAIAGNYPASRIPCLCDPSLPAVPESMQRDLDWMFGEGFADALAQAAGDE